MTREEKYDKLEAEVRLLIDAADDDGGDEVRGPIWGHIEECRKLLDME